MQKIKNLTKNWFSKIAISLAVFGFLSTSFVSPASAADASIDVGDIFNATVGTGAGGYATMDFGIFSIGIGGVPDGSLYEGLDIVGGELSGEITDHDDLRSYILQVVNWLLTFLGLVAVVVVIFAGYQMVANGQNADTVTKSKSMITYAVVGIFIILGSYALINSIIKFNDGGGSSGGSGNSVSGSVSGGTSSGVQSDGLNDLGLILSKTSSLYQERFNIYARVQDEMLDEIAEAVNDAEANGTCVADNGLEGVVQNITTSFEKIKATTFEDYMKNAKLKNVYTDTLDVKDNLKLLQQCSNATSTVQLDTAITSMQGVIYGESFGSEDGLGRINTPLARLVFNAGEMTDEGLIVKLNGSTSAPNKDSEISEIWYDFDMTVDSDGDGNASNDKDATMTSLAQSAKVSHPYAVSATPYYVLMAVENVGGESDTVIRSFLVSDTGIIVQDNGESEGDRSTARLNITSDTSSGNPFTVSLDPTSSVASSGANIESFYIDMDINTDTNGDGNPENDPDKSGISPTVQKYTYKKASSYKVKLVTVDSNGDFDGLVQKVVISDSGLSDVVTTNTYNTNEELQLIDGDELLNYLKNNASNLNGTYDYETIQQALASWYETSVPHTASINSAYAAMQTAFKQLVESPEYNSTLVTKFVEKINNLISEVGNVPPINVKISYTPSLRIKSGETIEFNGVSSTVPDGVDAEINEYCWVGTATDDSRGIVLGAGQKITEPVQSVTFDKPGSYVVSLDIPASGFCGIGSVASNAGSMLSGSDTVNVTVLPADTDIRLNITPPCRDNKSDENATGYNAGGVSEVMNNQTCYISLADARENGITFDPSNTAPANGRQISSMSWDIANDKFGPFPNPAGAIVNYTDVAYAGLYMAKLEVIDNTTAKDTFKVNVRVMELLADISIVPNTGGVKVPFKFSGAGSQADGATISEYSWVVNDAGGTTVFSSDQKIFTHEFTRAGEYTVSLTVKDTAGRTATSSQLLEVETVDPVARFEYSMKDKTTPATFLLDARKSYDLDATSTVICEWSIDGRVVGEGDCSTEDGTPINSNGVIGNIVDENGLPEPGDFLQLSPGIFQYTFEEKGPHMVELRVLGDYDKDALANKTIQVDSTLAVDFDMLLDGSSSYTAPIREEIYFKSAANDAVSYDWDFGDSDSTTTSEVSVSHTYNQAGNYYVTLKAYDSAGNKNSVTKQVVAGRSDRIVPYYNVYYGGQLVNEKVDGCNDDTLEISRKDKLTFNASDSLNRDGKKGNMDYVWDFDDDVTAEGVSVTHTYSEASLPGKCYNILLTVSDKDDPRVYSTQDFASVRVVNKPPSISDLRVDVQSTSNNKNITPLNVNVQAVGAKDADGSVIRYTWYYYTDMDMSQKLGMHKTSVAYTTFMIPPIGNEDEEHEYYFVLEVEDNEGAKTTSTDSLGADPMVTLVTGQNVPPTSRFTVNKTSTEVGDTVTFTAEKFNSLGEIMPSSGFDWDFDGDGHYDAQGAGPYVSYTYDKGGNFTAKLRITMNGLSSTYTMPIRIVPKSGAPTVAFLYEPLENGEVRFVNNSAADASLSDKTLIYAWDFDLTVDSDGDGDPKNDVDSSVSNPSFTYTDTTKTVYQVGLTVYDAVGISGNLIRNVNIGTAPTGNLTVALANEKDAQILAEAGVSTPSILAVALTTPERNQYDKNLYLKSGNQNVKVDFGESIGDIVEYRFDRNIYYDSDGDGNPANDVDNRDDKTFTKGGSLITAYDSEWAPMRSQLTVVSRKGNRSIDKFDVYFDKEPISYEEFIAQDDTLVGAFKTDKENLFAKEEITFDARGSQGDVVRYIWDFDGDGKPDSDSADSSAKWTFDSVGEYPIQLLILNSQGEYVSAEGIVKVVSPVSRPVAGFDYSMNGFEVDFYNDSTVDDAIAYQQPVYEWTFYDDPIGIELEEGAELSISRDSNTNPAHVFPNIGTYKVALKVTDYYGKSDTEEKEIKIQTTSPTVPDQQTQEETGQVDKTPSEPVKVDSAGFSWGGFILKIFIFGIIGIVILGALVLLVSLRRFKKKYPGHTFSDFTEYVKLTMAGEEYGDPIEINLDAIKKETEAMSVPQVEKSVVPEVEENIPAPKPASAVESVPNPKPAPAPLSVEEGKAPAWLKKAQETPVAKPEEKQYNNDKPNK